ncbi:MAG: hypothetical protein JNN00_15705 [Chitinophagaceae bacterium]|nr:hypothetical protein [Chitinophagaceae bacterium]
MKKLLFILNLLFVTSVPLFAQEEGDENEVGDKVRDKMTEYIQKRLDLSKDEAEKFTPIFSKYFREWVQTIRENRGDRLVLQQKIVELRLRYRPQFRDIVGEKRGNQVYAHQDIFVKEIQRLRQEQRMRNNPNRPLKRRVNRVF